MKNQILKTIVLAFLMFVSSVAFAEGYGGPNEDDQVSQDTDVAPSTSPSSETPPEAPSTRTPQPGSQCARVSGEGQQPASGAECQPAPPTPQAPAARLETITVTGRFNYCDPVQMRNRMRRNYEPSYGGLLKPGQDICGRAECVQEFHWNGNKGTTVSELNESEQKLTLISGYASCNVGEQCDREKSQYPRIEFLPARETADPSRFKSYFLKLNVKFDEMYDADYREVTVVCPEGSCFGVTMVNGSHHLIYTEKTQPDGRVVKRLVVNAVYGSKLKKTGTETNFQKCEYTP